MGARRRLVSFLAALTAAMLSAGGAWAASGHISPLGAHQSAHAADESASSSSSVVTDSSSSSTSTSTTDTTTVENETTSTTGVERHASTTEPENGSNAETGCKPGWGHGDTNHCHSGPPGLNKPKHQHEHEHDDQGKHGPEDDDNKS